MRIAIVSPNKNAYSETFIQAHRELLQNSVYYYGGMVPNELDVQGTLYPKSFFGKVILKLKLKLKRFLGKAVLTEREELFFNSLKKENIKLVLAEYGPTGCAVLPVCKKLNIPLIVHFHGYDASIKEVLEKYRSQYKEMFDYAAYIIAVSEPMMERLSALGAPKDKLVYNPCGPNAAFLHVQPTYEEQAILSVGRFVDKKAPYYSILAFSKVKQRVPHARLYMAGDGALLNTCKNLVQYLGLEQNVFFPGVITPAQLQERLSTVRAFVQHSVTADNGDMEGMPVGILEAQAAGVPVISTYHAGIPEAVLHGETGLLVREHDVDLMAEYMVRMLEDKEYAMQLGRAGKERMARYFSMERHIDQLNKIIAESITTN